ncbi:MAG TPA: dUTP diphosphatase [Dehalococcoidia bacterium]|nr:dUTP diphosphatase [Dehalococcoidia bacterium]
MESDGIVRVQRLHPGARLPARATAHATGFDLYARLDAPVRLGRHPHPVGTGIAVAAPPGYDVQVRPRSGLSARGVMVSFGTIDPDYRGEIVVTMWTFGDTDGYEVQDGDRIAQLVVSRAADVELREADDLGATARGAGGHGSTGR